jgi:hypothetical protein
MRDSFRPLHPRVVQPQPTIRLEPPIDKPLRAENFSGLDWTKAWWGELGFSQQASDIPLRSYLFTLSSLIFFLFFFFPQPTSRGPDAILLYSIAPCW